MAQKPPSRVELLRGTLDLLILRTLLPGPGHGHAIARHIQRTSEDLLKVETGSLYPALYRLEANGWVAASMVDAELAKLPADMRARLTRIFELIESVSLLNVKDRTSATSAASSGRFGSRGKPASHARSTSQRESSVS